MPDTTSISYGYDADGRRVKQTVGSAVTNYLWDEASVYGDVVLETDGSGSTLASYALSNNGIISQARSGVTNYYLQDGQGSTRALTNSTTGAITDTYSFNASGDIFSQTGTTTNSYLYTGQQFDSLTGLYSLRARYYNPALGRFLSQDTYPVNIGNPVELNRYVYTGNNPVNAMDPSGLNSVDLSITLQTGLAIGGPALTKIAIYTGAVIIGIALGLLFDQVVEAPPHGITWQELYQNETPPNPTPNPGQGFEPGEIAGATLALTLASLLAYGTVEQIIETDDDNQEKPIVLDFGPGINFEGEIIPLINFYRPLGIKVVAIEMDPRDASTLKRLSAFMPDDFDVIQGGYGSPDILKRNGYFGCALAAYSLWPNGHGAEQLPNAVNYHVCSGGYVQIVTENPYWYKDLKTGLQGSINFSNINNPVSLACINNPLMSKCADYRFATNGIGFHSGYNNRDQYAIAGYKR